MDGRDSWQNLSAAGTAAALQCHLSDCGRKRRGNRNGVSPGAAMRTDGAAATSRASISGKRTAVPSLREGLVVGRDRFRVVE
jgi:hypothetical protein